MLKQLNTHVFTTSTMVGTLEQIIESADNIMLIDYLDQHNPGPSQLFYVASKLNKLDVFNQVYSSLIIWAIDDSYTNNDAAHYLNSDESCRYIDDSYSILLSNPIEASKILHQIVEFSAQFDAFNIKIKQTFNKMSFPQPNMISTKQALLKPLEREMCVKCQQIKYRDHCCDEQEGTLRVHFRESDMKLNR